MRTTVHRCGDTHTKQQAGFTLVELAVVVFLVGLLAALGLEALTARVASASISATKKKQETIKDALISYLGRHKRLPCPDTDVTSPDGVDGKESRNEASPYDCKDGYFGILPYATLGLSKSTALDGYENFFSYAVSQQWTLTYGSIEAPPATTNNAGNAFNVGIQGTIIVKDNSTPAAVFIISHGRNGSGAFTSKGTQNFLPVGTDEVPNAPVKGDWRIPAAPGFFQREYNDNPPPIYFDDITLVLNPSDLITPLVKDGALKSAEAQWAEQVARINDMLVSYMLSPNTSSCAPPTQALFETELINNNIPKSDPWGGTLTYTQPITQLKNDGTPTPGTAIRPYTLTTSTAGQFINVPTIVTIYGVYKLIINSRCPPLP